MYTKISFMYTNILKCEYLFTGKRILAIICAWHKILDIYAQCTLWYIVYHIL